ncbi:hypothetical protein [Bradyrhizobium australiense]|uniref:Uncharacterized protein n=1 Tax=Bradyrhizobium australiense TaxID=2721161 RepID=A0A7Y4GXB7_9BRAD|nr:hypothetical protein [Bradyrhizobium australiense]NOJ43616.1 hypothetical protein [Bradyrhizobium australiense]
MAARQVLHHWRLPMEYVYFIERGLVSVSARIDENHFVEATPRLGETCFPRSSNGGFWSGKVENAYLSMGID